MYKVLKTGPERENIKLGIVGDSNVGKTFIILSFLNMELNNIFPTIAPNIMETEFISKYGEQKIITITDISGQEKLREYASLYMRFS